MKQKVNKAKIIKKVNQNNKYRMVFYYIRRMVQEKYGYNESNNRFYLKLEEQRLKKNFGINSLRKLDEKELEKFKEYCKKEYLRIEKEHGPAIESTCAFYACMPRIYGNLHGGGIA